MIVRAILATSVDEFFFMLRGKTAEESGPLEEVPDNRLEGLGVQVREVSMNRDHQVEPLYHFASLESDVLSKPSLDTIPGHRTAEPPSHGQAQTPFRAAVAADIEGEVPRGNLLAGTHHCPKLPRSANAIRSRKTLPRS